MNNRIKNIDLEKLLFFDIETVSRNKELELDSKEYSLFQWKHRNIETDEFLSDVELQKLYKKKAALNPIFNKIVCITVGYIKDNILYYKSLKGNQKTITENFYTILNNGYIPAGHNIIGFDLPVTRLKAFESGCEVLIPEKTNDVESKPWVLCESVLDTMSVTKGTYFYNLSLDDMCFLAGIESPKDKINGSEVTQTYYEDPNGLEIICEYCEKDVIAVAKLICKLCDKEDFIKDVVSKNDIKIELPPVLEVIYNENNISKESKKRLLELLGKKRLLKKDKPKIITILHSLSVNSEMFKGDKPEVIQEKLEKVEKLIEGL